MTADITQVEKPTERPDHYEKFKKYEVEATDLASFCERYHKASAWHNRPADYREADYNGHLNDLAKYGYTIIPHHDSTTGEVVSYYSCVDDGGRTAR